MNKVKQIKNLQQRVKDAIEVLTLIHEDWAALEGKTEVQEEMLQKRLVNAMNALTGMHNALEIILQHEVEREW